MAAPAGHLKVVDTRTDKSYEIPIHTGNYIKAKDLSAITITEDELPRKLHILDNGYESTACMDSSITHMYARCLPRHAVILTASSDGQRGEVRYRGVPIQDLFRDNDFEDVLHLLLWSKLPSEAERAAVRKSVNAASVPPTSVINTIAAFP